MFRIVLQPFRDVLVGLDSQVGKGAKGIVLVFLGLAIGWWLYVPVHELLHAFGCMATGGEVTELQIQTMYGGSILAAIFPWVTAGGEYAGRLTGFDTGGCDGVYLATDFAPFLLTLFPGIYGLRAAARRKNGFLFGFFVPLAFAPLISIPGDAYEIGSILVTRIPPWSEADLVTYLRGDDVVVKWEEIRGDTDWKPWAGWILATLVGVLWAFLTYHTGAFISKLLGCPAVSPDKAQERSSS